MRIIGNRTVATVSGLSSYLLFQRITARLAGSAFLLAALLSLTFKTSPAFAKEWYVDASAEQPGDGASWETAFKTIQEGIDAAEDGNIVVVAPGTYLENVRFTGKNVLVTTTDPLDRNIVATTIIDGGQRGPVVSFDGTEDGSCALLGFTIQNGKGNEGAGILGGQVHTHTDATIRGNVIERNSALYYGGGVAFCGGVIQNNMVCENSAGSDGGGLYGCNGIISGNLIAANSAKRGAGLASCQAMIEDNTISRNRASGEGGALYGCDRTIRNNDITRCSAYLGGALAQCDGPIQRNLISGNGSAGAGALYNCDGEIDGNTISANWGGGLYECHGSIHNNIISYNEARNGAGLAYCHGLVQNNAVINNTAQGAGGGLYGCAAVITNCIIWANEAGRDYAAQLFSSNELTYSSIQDWSGGEGNISEDPRFVDPDGPDDDPDTYEDNDYRLRSDSPCIDAGFNDPDLPETDIAGMHRIMFGGRSLTVDMGAYEFYINRVEPVPGTDEAIFTWSSLADRSYTIFYTDDLFNWQTAIDNFPSLGNQTTSWVDDGSVTGLPPSLVPRRFYRILENQ